MDNLENGSLPYTPIEKHQTPPKASSISSDPREPESPEELVQASEETLPKQPEVKETSEETTEKESKDEMESKEETDEVEKNEVENEEKVENIREEPNESQSPPAQVTEAETTENPISDLEADSMNVLYKVQ